MAHLMKDIPLVLPVSARIIYAGREKTGNVDLPGKSRSGKSGKPGNARCYIKLRNHPQYIVLIRIC